MSNFPDEWVFTTRNTGSPATITVPAPQPGISLVLTRIDAHLSKGGGVAVSQYVVSALDGAAPFWSDVLGTPATAATEVNDAIISADFVRIITIGNALTVQFSAVPLANESQTLTIRGYAL